MRKETRAPDALPVDGPGELGEPVPRKVLDFGLSDEERQILETIREVLEKELVPIRSRMDENEEFPDEFLAHFRDIGGFAAFFPVEYGGLGLRKHVVLRISELLGEYCLAVSTVIGASAILAAGPILFGGSEEQKRRYLPRLASGESLASFCISEPDAGSDVFALSTQAVETDRGFLLNGTKQWITNAGRSDLYCVFALSRKDVDPRSGVSCFLVEKDTPGLSFGPLERKLGIRASHTRQVILDNVEIPMENRIGRPHQGMSLALKVLTSSRTSMAASAVGLAYGAYKEALRYTMQRRQFGKRIIEFQVIQHMLADMLVKIESARLMVFRAGQALEDKVSDALMRSAMAKYQAAETAMEVATDALQLHGGYGFSRDYPIEKMFRDAKILAIYEGTSQMMKNQITAQVIKDASRYR